METKHHADLTYLKEISNGSQEFINEMISVFIKEVPAEIDKLEKNLIAKDWKSLKTTAHKMKSSFSIMGIKELESDIKLVNDYSAQESNLDLLPAMITRIKNVGTETIKELESLLAK